MIGRWMGRFGPAALIAAVLLAAAPPVVATEPSFFGADDRVFIEPVDMPWSAIGRLDFGEGAHCSGAMVSPRVVLTAAHCLFRYSGGAYEDQAEFYAGFDRSRHVAQATVESFWVSPGYLSKDPFEEESAGNDYAFVLLDQPIGNRTGYFSVHRMTEADLADAARGNWRKLVQAGYSGDSSDQLSAHFGCRILSVDPNNRIGHQCDIMSGDSGSPIFFADERGDWQVIAVNSSVYVGPRPKNWAVDSRAFADDLDRFLRRYE